MGDHIKRQRFSKDLTFCVIAALAFGVLTTLSGCVGGESVLGRVAKAFSDEPPLPASSTRELSRFKNVYLQYAKPGNSADQLEHFEEAYRRVRKSYVRKITDMNLIDSAIKGVRSLEAMPNTVEPPLVIEAALDSMMTSLDPHSSYLNPQEFRELQTSTRGEFGGLGIEVTMENGLVKVVAPIEGTPAARADLKPGDLITHVDGRSLKDKTLINAVRELRGEPGSEVVLTIQRGKEAPFTVPIERAVIHVRAVRWRTEGDVGYIRLARFTESATNDLHRAVKDIRNQLGAKLKGYVLDLRNNAGGLLDQSLSVSDSLLQGGVIVSVRGRYPQGGQVFDADRGDITDGKPIVVLINGGSASASEIVAVALQENKRAILMGEQSFGKGSVQTITPLKRKGALRLTTQLYYSPKGNAIQAHGVDPDIALIPAKKEADKKRNREADLPGHLETKADWKHHARASLKETSCPAVGEKKDRGLGCALEYLHAGSTEKFLANVRARPNI
ncbi:MAG: S41 family peptidase [Rhodospirillaceae bacterium]